MTFALLEMKKKKKKQKNFPSVKTLGSKTLQMTSHIRVCLLDSERVSEVTTIL